MNCCMDDEGVAVLSLRKFPRYLVVFVPNLYLSAKSSSFSLSFFSLLWDSFLDDPVCKIRITGGHFCTLERYSGREMLFNI